MVNIILAGSGANKGFWRVQLRDRYGKFVEMGGAVLFDIQLPGVIGKSHAVGNFIGNAEPGLARVEVKDNKKIPKGIYLVKSEDITAIQAILPEAYVERQTLPVLDAEAEQAVPEATPKTEDIVAPGFENWMPALADVLALTADSEGEDNNFDPELGDKRLAIFMERAGYNSRPKVVSAEEFNLLEGETLYRGVTDEKFADQYKNSSKHFAGTGTFGNGTYSSNNKGTANMFGGEADGKILEMKLSSDANVLYLDTRQDILEWIKENSEKFIKEYENFGANVAEIQEFKWQIDNTSDWTNLAIMLGVDAIRFPPSMPFPGQEIKEHYTIILNRGKVVVNAKS
jgi:hypothetical protein